MQKVRIVDSVRNCGPSMRYMLSPGSCTLDLQGSSFPAGICGVCVNEKEIAVSYIGLGGGGVGASGCRALPEVSCDARLNHQEVERKQGRKGAEFVLLPECMTFSGRI